MLLQHNHMIAEWLQAHHQDLCDGNIPVLALDEFMLKLARLVVMDGAIVNSDA